jgi:hypothetical protein
MSNPSRRLAYSVIAAAAMLASVDLVQAAQQAISVVGPTPKPKGWDQIEPGPEQAPQSIFTIHAGPELPVLDSAAVQSILADADHADPSNTSDGWTLIPGFPVEPTDSLDNPGRLREPQKRIVGYVKTHGAIRLHYNPKTLATVKALVKRGIVQAVQSSTTLAVFKPGTPVTVAIDGIHEDTLEPLKLSA